MQDEEEEVGVEVAGVVQGQGRTGRLGHTGHHVSGTGPSTAATD